MPLLFSLSLKRVPPEGSVTAKVLSYSLASTSENTTWYSFESFICSPSVKATEPSSLTSITESDETAVPLLKIVV